MRDWLPNRGCAYEQRFWDDLGGLGITQEQWDDLSPSVDVSLFGASDAKLDWEYPIRIDGLRLILTEAFHSIPPLRIAFIVDRGDNGKIVYVAVWRR